ncbi:MAG: SRPBCC domain-containing protein [Actinomycetota bacterium]|nr:SRPBCC domain-containing protein [Actinomycetota bacterium]
MTASVVRVSRIVAAPREHVFRAWTDPRNVERWWGRPDGVAVAVTEMDARPGGGFRIVMGAGEGAEMAMAGTYVDLVPPERLVFLFEWDRPLPIPGGDSGASRVTVEFHERGETTEVVVIHEGQPTREMEGFHLTGWTWSLDRLASLEWT